MWSPEAALGTFVRMTYEHLRYEVADGIGTVTFSRPDKMNALTYDSYREFEHLTRALAHDCDVKVLVVRGEGDHFCAGGDVHTIIGDLLPKDAHDHYRFTQMTGACVRNLREMPQPAIAQIQGLAVGAGSVIALACDLRVMAEGAKFGFIFTKVGLTGADMGAAYLLPRIVGLGRASELLLFGDNVKADECLRIGLANRVVPAEDLAETVAGMAKRLAEGPHLAQEITKRLLQRELDQDFASAMESETLGQALLLMGGDHAEFYEAWCARRKPEWKGR